MKKSIITILLAVFFTLTAVHSWEGAGVVAPEGELPVTGFYVATDTFPRNTVVDITNIETGKSTRAIVANRLDSPDILAIISREAAELIGMRAGSVTRIRMVQPSEPIAATRFFENAASGIPEYSSGNVLTEELYRDDRYRLVSQPEPDAAPVEIKPPSYVLEQEWRTRDVIVDFPNSDYRPPIMAFTPFEKVTGILPEVKPEEIAESLPEESIYEDEPTEITEAFAEEEVEEEPAEIAEVIPYIEEFVYEDRPEEIAEAFAEEGIEEEPEEIAEALTEEESLESPYVLSQAEEKPPVSSYEINPDDIIPGIRLPEPEWAPEPSAIAAETPPEILPETPPVIAETPPEVLPETPPVIVETPPEVLPETPPVLVETSQEVLPETPSVIAETPPEVLPEIPSVIVLPETPPVVVETPPATVPPQVTTPVIPVTTFSVKTITELDWNRYYVQIAAFDNPQSVENALKQINRSYEPVIYKDSGIWYRILIGPLNQGESAAVLQRFKSIGYNDAFIRYRS